ncbi:hypothetical protein [Nocardia grenadensis]|uniref:hypothetical protein n=1 Tax=Nocardia grenadensis TaxID=931537 RepID=UPI0007A40B8F|nr:hypothetical protein [Nocardia grenadensis]
MADIGECVGYPPIGDDWTVSRILEEGSKSLLFFEKFEPRYQRWVSNPPANILGYQALHTVFYAQNGLDEQRFRDLAAALAGVLSNADAQHAALNQYAQNLPSIWSGQAAANAADMIATQLSLSAGDIDAVRKIHEQFDMAPAALRKTVKPKAEMVQVFLEDMYQVTYDGKSPEDVDSIISAAQGIGWSTGADDHLLGKIHRIFPDLPNLDEYVFITVPGSGNTDDIEDHCRDWLNKFKDHYEKKVTEFVQTCTDINDGVRAQYGTLIDRLGKLSQTPYPCPQGVAQTPGTPGSETPTTQVPTGSPSGTPSGTPTGTGTPGTTDIPGAETEDPGTTDEDNPLSALTELGTQLASSGLGTQLVTGLSELASSAAEQISGTLEQLLEEAEQEVDLDGDGQPDVDEDGDGQPDDPTGNAEDDPAGTDEETGANTGIELDGKEYKLELGPDGRLHLVVTGADGEPQNYRIEIGPDGKPAIAADVPEGEQAPGTGDPSAEDQQNAGRPSGTPGLPGGRRAEDGEHQPRDYPAPAEDETAPPEADTTAPEDDVVVAPEEDAPAPPPAAPVDTGAQLAEAGPL